MTMAKRAKLATQISKPTDTAAAEAKAEKLSAATKDIRTRKVGEEEGEPHSTVTFNLPRDLIRRVDRLSMERREQRIMDGESGGRASRSAVVAEILAAHLSDYE
jgi:hypothetical protein